MVGGGGGGGRAKLLYIHVYGLLEVRIGYSIHTWYTAVMTLPTFCGQSYSGSTGGSYFSQSYIVCRLWFPSKCPENLIFVLNPCYRLFFLPVHRP